MDSLTIPENTTFQEAVTEIEIGCGNGHFISRYAEANKEKYLIGIELKQKRCLKAVKKVNENKLTNVKIIQSRAEAVLKQLPALSVDKFHIYFPDPWPKFRHRKRRFLRMQNLKILYSVLKPGGGIFFITDFFDYYMQTKILLLLYPGFRLKEEPFPDEVFISIYGKKFMGAGKPVYYLSAEKAPDSALTLYSNAE